MILQAALKILGCNGGRTVDASTRRSGGSRSGDALPARRQALALTAIGASEDPNRLGRLRAVAQNSRQLALSHSNVMPRLVTRPLATSLGQAAGRNGAASSHCSHRPLRRRGCLPNLLAAVPRLAIIEIPNCVHWHPPDVLRRCRQLDRVLDLLCGLTAALTGCGGQPPDHRRGMRATGQLAD